MEVNNKGRSCNKFINAPDTLPEKDGYSLVANFVWSVGAISMKFFFQIALF